MKVADMPLLGTVVNHGNMEMTENMIFVKCRKSRDFAGMPCFCHVFFVKMP